MRNFQQQNYLALQESWTIFYPIISLVFSSLNSIIGIKHELSSQFSMICVPELFSTYKLVTWSGLNNVFIILVSSKKTGCRGSITIFRFLNYIRSLITRCSNYIMLLDDENFSATKIFSLWKKNYIQTKIQVLSSVCARVVFTH